MDKALSEEVAKEVIALENADGDADDEHSEQNDDARVTTGKLVVEEEIHKGRANWPSRECSIPLSAMEIRNTMY